MRKWMLMVLLAPAAAGAQEPPPARGEVLDASEFFWRYGAPPTYGMVLDGGEWREPTPADAIRALVAPTPGMGNPRAPAIALLTQQFESRPRGELDALANELADLILGGDEEQQRSARVALLLAADPEEGTPYAGAADAFARVYETLRERSDPGASYALRRVFKAGGVDYVRRVFEESEQPEPCEMGGWTSPDNAENVVGPPVIKRPCPNVSIWCDAGELLYQIGEGPDLALLEPLCRWGLSIHHLRGPATRRRA